MTTTEYRCRIYLLTLFLLFPCQLFAANERLKHHSSPYLRDHAEDAIHWRTLTAETIDTARKKNLPILLSSGYLSCYWCYRMKRDTFNDRELAELVNQEFLPILIDRELHQEEDDFLQRFMQYTAGAGGWPVTVITTPQAYPVAGFSYRDASATKETLMKFLDLWRKNPNRLTVGAKNIFKAMAETQSEQQQLLNDSSLLDLLEALLQQANAAADTQYGGFGNHEKYPYWPQLQTLLELNRINPDPVMSKFLVSTLKAMLTGGLRDSIGGGFFRYSSDRSWKNPHFEMMLYTQALAVKPLLLAGEQFENKQFIETAAEVVKVLIRDFKKQNGFYHASISAVDDVGVSGGYYFWQRKSLLKNVGENWQDRIENLSDNETLVLPGFKQAVTAQVRQQLLDIRLQRPKKVDDKALTGWNGLVLSAFSQAAATMPVAEKAANELAHLLMQSAGKKTVYRLLDNASSGPAGLADRIYLARGLVDWWEISREQPAMDIAIAILQEAYDDFHSSRGWQLDNGQLLFPAGARFAIPDTQLPSPSALWFDTVWKIRQHSDENSPNHQLFDAADEIAAVRIQGFRFNAFFHVTALAALIRQTILQQDKGQVSE